MRIKHKKGDEMYVYSSFYISRGSDDVCGGLAKIEKIEQDKDIHTLVWVMFEGLDSAYNYEHLLEKQNELKDQFGSQKAHPCPDIDTPWIEKGDYVNGEIWTGGGHIITIMKIQVTELRAAIEHLQATQGKKGTFFSITARTRGTGELRRYNASFNYGKYKKGGDAAYDFIEKNLLVVWDQLAFQKMKKGEGITPIRSINCDKIWNCRVCGVSLIQEGNPTREYLTLLK